MTRSVTGAAWIVNMFKGLHQADSGSAHVGLGQSLIVNNKFAAGANLSSWRLSAMHSECGGPAGSHHAPWARIGLVFETVLEIIFIVASIYTGMLFLHAY